jgi:hypothetical protein
MKNLLSSSLVILLTLFTVTSVKAQSEERNKMVMTINFGGKNIITEISTVSLGITRYDGYTAPATESTATTSADPKTKTATPERGSYYLAINLKKVDVELLKLMSKKATRFDGTITLTDTYGKNKPREIKFRKAGVDSYSDQFSTISYDDTYGTASLVLSCQGLTVDGVDLE